MGNRGLQRPQKVSPACSIRPASGPVGPAPGLLIVAWRRSQRWQRAVPDTIPLSDPPSSTMPDSRTAVVTHDEVAYLSLALVITRLVPSPSPLGLPDFLA